MSHEMSVKRSGAKSKSCPERKKMEKDLEELSEEEKEVPEKKNSKLTDQDVLRLYEEMEDNLEDYIEYEASSDKKTTPVVSKKKFAKEDSKPSEDTSDYSPTFTRSIRRRTVTEKIEIEEEEVKLKRNHKVPIESEEGIFVPERKSKVPAKKTSSKEDPIESDEESGFDLESSDVDDKPMKQLAPRKGAVEESEDESTEESDEESNEDTDEESEEEPLEAYDGPPRIKNFKTLNDYNPELDEETNGKMYI